MAMQITSLPPSLPTPNAPANSPAQAVPVVPVATQVAGQPLVHNAVAALPKSEPSRKKLSNEERAKGGEKIDDRRRHNTDDAQRGQSVNVSV